MRPETRLLRKALRLLYLSRPADPRHGDRFDAVVRAVERFTGKLRRPSLQVRR